jgi:hypothetical protein
MHEPHAALEGEPGAVQTAADSVEESLDHV